MSAISYDPEQEILKQMRAQTPHRISEQETSTLYPPFLIGNVQYRVQKYVHTVKSKEGNPLAKTTFILWNWTTSSPIHSSSLNSEQLNKKIKEIWIKNKAQGDKKESKTRRDYSDHYPCAMI